MKVLTIQEFLQNQVGESSRMGLFPSVQEVTSQLKDTTEAIKSFVDSTGDFFKGISKVFYYIAHPKTLAWIMWSGLVKYSFWICLFICLFSIVAYIIGWEKGKTWAKGSVITYIVIMMFNSAL